MKLTIGYLYGDLMNIYGDTGNIICLEKRCVWRGIDASVKQISIGNDLKAGEVDLFFFGGGQDQAQTDVAKDLVKKASVLKEENERGVPLLAICGGYQLLGKYYQPFDGKKLEGVGIFKASTEASNDRMIGNIVIRSSFIVSSLTTKNQSDEPTNELTNNLLVGFENHSGKTFLEKSGKPLGSVIKGFGNNGEDKSEGCISNNAIGCYMHGSLSPKNPELADWLIKKALEVKYKKEINLKPLNDELEQKAHDFAVKKFS